MTEFVFAQGDENAIKALFFPGKKKIRKEELSLESGDLALLAIEQVKLAELLDIISQQYANDSLILIKLDYFSNELYRAVEKEINIDNIWKVIGTLKEYKGFLEKALNNRVATSELFEIFKHLSLIDEENPKLLPESLKHIQVIVSNSKQVELELKKNLSLFEEVERIANMKIKQFFRRVRISH